MSRVVSLPDYFKLMKCIYTFYIYIYNSVINLMGYSSEWPQWPIEMRFGGRGGEGV